MSGITQEEWDSWRSNPTTKAFFKMLEGEREKSRDNWERGAYISTDSPEMTGIINALAVERCRLFRELQETDFEQFKANLASAAELKE